jgi:hypothetical protein
MQKVKEAWEEESYVKSKWEGDAHLPRTRRRQRQRSRFTVAMYQRYGGQAWLRILFALGRVDELCVKIVNDELKKIMAEKGVLDEQGCRTNAVWQGWQDAEKHMCGARVRVWWARFTSVRVLGACMCTRRQDWQGWSGSSPRDGSWRGWQDRGQHIHNRMAMHEQATLRPSAHT